MEYDFKVDRKKLIEKGSDGINIMFYDGRVNHCYGGAVGIISEFMANFYYFPDIETLVLDKEIAKEVAELIRSNRENITKEMNEIIKEQGYDAQSDVIIEKTLNNIDNGKERYGMYLTFETLIV